MTFGFEGVDVLRRSTACNSETKTKLERVRKGGRMMSGFALALVGAFTLGCVDAPVALEDSFVSPVNSPGRKIVIPPIVGWPTTKFGIGTHGFLGDITRMNELGAKFTRITFYTARDQTEPGYGDEFLNRLIIYRANGVEPLVVVHDFDRYSVSAPTLIASLATRYPNTIWQIGNEWNSPTYRGNHYAALMINVKAAVAIANPGAQIVGMGIAGWDNTFTDEYLAYPNRPILRAWCVNAYGVGVESASKQRADSVMADLNGLMPLWVTETGYSRTDIQSAWGARTDAEIDQDQADLIHRAINEAANKGIERVYFFHLDDGAVENGGPDYGYGFLRGDKVTIRPAYTVLYNYFQTYDP